MDQEKMPRGYVASHRFAVFLACCVVLLIAAGGLVTSKQAGLSVPDWPLSFGSINPPGWWEMEDVRAEHGHRLIAGSIAIMVVILAAWLIRTEDRRWVKRLALIAVTAVFLQALLGGLTVLLSLPTIVSVSHAGLAQIFLALIVTLAVTTSKSWREGGRVGTSLGGSDRLARVATVASGLIYTQILIGAVMRHSGAGLAIPDFPLSFGRLVPIEFDFAIGINFTHRVGAVLVTVTVFLLYVLVWRNRESSPGMRVSATVMAVLVITQFSLGAAIVLTGKWVPVNTLHVATGASLFAMSIVLTLKSWRSVFVNRSAESGDRRSAEVSSGQPVEVAQ